MEYIELIVATIFVNNILLAQFLGNCPFLGTSKKMETAVGMAMAVIFVLVMAGVITWIVYEWLLVPFKLQFLRTIAFILVIASLVQFVEMFLKKSIPALYAGLGIFLPLITTNCAVMGMAVIAVQNNYNALESFIAGFSAGVGFLLAIVLMSTIREKLDSEWIPKPFQGVSIAFITGGLMAMAFMAFDKTLLNNLFPGL